MTHDELKALLPLAALDRLEPDEMAQVREHLAGCPECRAELREFEHAVAMMALAVDAPTSADRITRKLEARFAAPARVASPAVNDRPASRSAEPSNRAGTRSIAMRLSIAAAVVLAVYGAVVTSRLSSLQSAYDARANQLAYLQTRFTTLEHEAQAAEQKIDALSKVLSERIRLEDVLDAPDLEVTRLAPLPPAPGAHAVVITSKSSGTAVLRASGLDAPPAGKTYQLWWITKQKGPVPAGTFTAESGNEVIAKVDPPPAGDRVTLTAVTLEPTGGVPKPTGAMYLKGSPERE
jgi:Anti-sigma-K factor rskA/Putative zinc-finger